MINVNPKIKKRITFLNDKLHYCNNQYYRFNNSPITDQEFDQLLAELNKLENQYPELKLATSPTMRVGGFVSKKFSKVKHSQKMLSLSNVFNKEELLNFDKQVQKWSGLSKIEYVAELKIDGLSISLQYENHHLVRALTRGNGFEGEDVTNNIKTIRDIPLQLKTAKKIEVRGEIFFFDNDFNKMNQLRAQKNEKVFANSRNAAAGSVRQLDSKVTGQRKLSSFIYYYLNPLGDQISTQSSVLDNIKKLGFRINQEYCIGNIEDVWKFIETIDAKRATLGFPTDGIAIKVNDINLYQKIGNTVKFPKWATAYKFSEKTAITTLKDIVVNIGRTGKVNYNAILEPISLCGTTVANATLHNANYIQELDIRIGAQVEIKKAGDIIPKVLKAIKNDRYQKLPQWIKPTHCPVCNSELISKKNYVDYYCANKDCLATHLENIVHFVSNPAMNIVGLGKSIVERFFKLGILKNIVSIYELEKYQDIIINEPRFGQKSYNNIIESINLSKNNSLERLIFGLGIRNIGFKNATIIAKRFNDLNSIMALKADDLTNISNFGKVVSDSLITWLANEDNIKILQELINHGLNPKYNGVAIMNNKLNGKVFSITGTLSLPRNEIKEIIELHGGVFQNTVTNKVDFLITNNLSENSNKYQSAINKNIEIINEIKFKELLK